VSKSDLLSGGVVLIPEVPHSKRGASGAHIWSNCKGQVNLVEKLGRKNKLSKGSNIAAAEGTVAHIVGSTALDEGSDAYDFLDMEFKCDEWSFVIDKEKAEGIQVYLDYVRGIMERYPDAMMFVEHKMSSVFDPDAWGTSDCIILIPSIRTIYIIDLKFGKGITVEPDSIQNKYYGALALEEFGTDFEKVILCISQPRIPHPLGLNREITISADRLMTWWTDVLLRDMEESRDPNAFLRVGNHCTFCRAKNNCPALKKESFSYTTDIDPSHFSNEEIGELLAKGPAVKAMIESLKKEAYYRKMAGQHIPGQKLVYGQSKRIFKDNMTFKDEQGENYTISIEKAVKDTFGDAGYVPAKMLTAPALEKIDHPEAKNFVAQWAYKPQTDLTIAPISDKRVEVIREMDEYHDLIDSQGDPDF
jgi:hypothetical protein